MRLNRRRALCGGLALAMGAVHAHAAATQSLDGEWYGAIYPGARRLLLRLVIVSGSANLFSLDQGSKPIVATRRKSMARTRRSITALCAGAAWACSTKSSLNSPPKDQSPSV